MLLIDCREPKEIIEILSKNIPTRIIKLAHGDYLFFCTAIERKTLSDFFTSFKTGRLIEQITSIKTYNLQISRDKKYHLAKFLGIFDKKLYRILDRFENFENIVGKIKSNKKNSRA